MSFDCFECVIQIHVNDILNDLEFHALQDVISQLVSVLAGSRIRGKIFTSFPVSYDCLPYSPFGKTVFLSQLSLMYVFVNFKVIYLIPGSVRTKSLWCSGNGPMHHQATQCSYR